MYGIEYICVWVKTQNHGVWVVFGLKIDRYLYTLVYKDERNVPMFFGEDMCDGERDMV